MSIIVMNLFSEKSMQRLFVLDKAKCLIGRQAELDLLKSFAGCGSANDLVRTGCLFLFYRI